MKPEQHAQIKKVFLAACERAQIERAGAPNLC